MKTKVLIFIAIFLFGIILYFPYISGKEFQGEEGRRVLIALQMLESREYLIPQLFGEPYFNKPPLFNLALALFFKLTGDYSELTARALSALSIIFSALFLTFIWIKLLEASKERACLSAYHYLLPGLIFLTIPEVIDKALRAEIDAFYTMVITFGLYSWFYLHEIKGKRKVSFIVLGIFLGLGLLTKTFQALIFFYLAYIPYLFFQRRLREFFSFSHLLGIFTLGLVFLFWAIPVSQKMGLKPFLVAWLYEYLSAGKAQEMSFLQHLENYTVSALLGFSPWIFALLTLRSPNFKNFLKENTNLYRLFLFSLFLFFFGYVFHFLFPGARLRYMLPSVSGLVMTATLIFYYSFLKDNFLKRYQIFFNKIFPSLSLLLAIVIFFYFFRKNWTISWFVYINFLLFIFLNLLAIIKELSMREVFFYFVFYVFLVKQLFVGFYYPFHQKEKNYFINSAFLLSMLMGDKKELYLCGVIPHHLVYYLKYRYHLLEKIFYLRDCKKLPSQSYLLLKDLSLISEKEKIDKVFPLRVRNKLYYLVLTR